LPGLQLVGIQRCVLRFPARWRQQRRPTRMTPHTDSAAGFCKPFAFQNKQNGSGSTHQTGGHAGTPYPATALLVLDIRECHNAARPGQSWTCVFARGVGSHDPDRKRSRASGLQRTFVLLLFRIRISHSCGPLKVEY